MRVEGWEKRLQAVLDAARAKPLVWGTHDCLRFTCAVVEALTGEDRWPLFAGAYSTEREALKLLSRYGGDFAEAGDWFFGSRRVDARLARRGDVVACPSGGVIPALGVCVGRTRVAALGEVGLLFLPQRTGLYAWGVG